MDFFWTGAYIFWFYVIIKVTSFVYLRFLKPKYDWTQFRGEWALISGSSDGSGKSLAFSLAKRGINVILVARSKQKMDVIASEIQNKFGVQTKVISVDFAGDQDLAYNTIQKEIQGLQISVLVNNVGGAADSFSRFDNPMDYYYNIPWAYDEYMTRINLIPALRLSKMILPQMIQRRKGAVLTVSTLASTFGMPFLTAYTYNKAALNIFTADIALECKSHKITIGIAYAGVMNTPGVQNGPLKALDEFGACHPDQFAEAAISSFGRELHIAPYWFHAIQFAFMNAIPEYIRDMLILKVGTDIHVLGLKAKTN